MLISFLKKTDEDGKENGGGKFMGMGDIIFLLVIAALVFGFWYFNKSTKEKTIMHYAKCDSLFTAQEYEGAKECYEDVLDLGYRTDSLDSVGYHRIEEIDSFN
ncbi:hypothetical protein AGMMS49938_10270 [Fibrobacterales bacterium]|nr:hypothetical protein AGMMS49938_10270 [Fibrobacterales bacterium]